MSVARSGPSRGTISDEVVSHQKVRPEKYNASEIALIKI